MNETEEHRRLYENASDPMQMWKRFGPYVSERAWGTVREDYSPSGDAWNYLTHEKARSTAYRWGEDGIAGFSDRFQTLVLSFAFWNEKDPILKERLFGLNPYEGNHAEDVKECYYYLDATPTHSYMKYLYKYPQREFPYQKLIEENKKRAAKDREYEIYDTGIFDEERYFDIFIEYAKKSEEDLCIRLEVFNRGKEKASLHILPQLTFRNKWSWDNNPSPLTPIIKKVDSLPRFSLLCADPCHLSSSLFNYSHDQISKMYFYGYPSDALFTNNETHNEKVWGSKSRTPYVKDAFHRYIIGKEAACNPSQEGTKAALHYKEENISGGDSRIFYFRLTSKMEKNPLEEIEEICRERRKEADLFYQKIHPKHISEEDRMIQRQALAGMLWNKQFYFYNVHEWLKGDNPKMPPPESRFSQRNAHWKHLEAKEIISMPDKWEYPWFAAWDLAFHTLTLSLVDIDFAKQQLHTVLQHQYQHPNGQIPAYEWGFSDLNPPVQAWALWRVYQKECAVKKRGDRAFLEVCFLKLLRNFNWWVNKVDRVGNNFFEGGFLGLDNISIIDRSKPLWNGGFIEQSDGTGWMGFFALTMMRIALELSKENPGFQVMATIFLEHFFYIASAMQREKPILGERSINMWDIEDEFFYDVVSYPEGRHEMLKVRSFVGIIPTYSIEILEESELALFPSFRENFYIFMKDHPKLTERFVTVIPNEGQNRYLLSLMTVPQIEKVLKRVASSQEFYSPYGLRSLSKYHENHPMHFETYSVCYEPGESLERIKGGNSNWRGPIWFPTNYLFLEAMDTLIKALGTQFNFLSSEGKSINLSEMIKDVRTCHMNIFRKNIQGYRPVHGETKLYQGPHWENLLLFYEHFHAENGRGLGASHQTGWTGLVANMIDEM